MRVKDRDKQRRLARDEREARKKPKKRQRCGHEFRTAVSPGVTKCKDCGSRIVQKGR